MPAAGVHPQNAESWLIMRSLLFVPADSERKLAKGLSSGADALILDLEDSVSAEMKPRARELVHAALVAARKDPTAARPRLYVRINALSSPYWQADLAALTPAGSSLSALPDGVMLPKPQSGEDVHQLSVALGHAEEKSKVAAGSTKIIAIATEVPASVLRLPSYIGASNRLEGLTWGAEDLSVELGSSTNREPDGAYTSPYRLVRDLTLITAAAAAVQPIDTVYIDFRNLAGLALESSIAARDGFTGKMAIHPDQVAVINEAFTPSAAEIARSHAVVEAFRVNPGAGVVSISGVMVDRPHLTRAERVLARVSNPIVSVSNTDKVHS
jgi:citrate lyase subunit beta / citryl-CoA lyase